MRIPRRWFVVPVIFVAAAILVAVFVSSSRRHSILAARSTLLTVSEQYPKFTLAQRMAVLRELQLERHPRWRDLSLADLTRVLLKWATESSISTQPSVAPFLGNATVINAPLGDLVGMDRTSNCSLTMGYSTYTLSLPTVNYDIAGETSNFDQVLHTAAGLTTTGGNWPAGCGDPLLGITSRSFVPTGVTTSNVSVITRTGYDPVIGYQVIFTLGLTSLEANNMTVGEISNTNADPIAVAATDFNGDGNGDLAVINGAATSGSSASVAILLGNADGSFKSPLTYSLPGDNGISLVIDDFNGDGKPDIVATTSSFASGSTTYSISFLAGNGDGTFQSPQSTTMTPPSGFSSLSGSVPYFGLVSADLLGNGKKDLVTSAGVVLLGNGDGTFTQSSTVAFSTPASTSEWSPNVVAGDFNKDGKIDLAVDNGESISIYLGKGDGTFTADGGYASIANVGYLNATDLDGDGNVDLYSGIARGGKFGGDQFEPGQAYALMGNGDGTFQRSAGAALRVHRHEHGRS